MLFSWLSVATEKHNTYQLLYIYSIPPDDGLQICPKYVEVDWRNKLRINTASSWLSWHGSITPFTRAHNLSLPKSNKTSPYASLDYFNNHFNTYFLCPSASSLWNVSTLFTMYFFVFLTFPMLLTYPCYLIMLNFIALIINGEQYEGAYRILVGKPEVKWPLGRQRHRKENNIKMDIQEIECWAWIWLIWLRI